MRWIFFVFLLFAGGGAIASENLMENIREYSNVIIGDGVVYQDYARPLGAWKSQARYDNDKHIELGHGSYEPLFYFYRGNTGFISYTFTTPDDLEDLVDFIFGFNGTGQDTLVRFDIKDVVPNTTYTLQWRVLSTTLGEIAWTDMLLVHCPDEYELALGDTMCSRECANQPVAGGYIPPDITKVYEPEICTYDKSNLVCDDGYVRIDDACEQICTSGIKYLYAGGNRNGLYVRRVGTPALHVKYNGNICYGHLVRGMGAGLNIQIGDSVYHLTD